MIEKEYGKYFCACDACGDVTPIFDSWSECREHIKDEGWKTTKNKDTNEWENYCPACTRKIQINSK